MPPPTNQKNTLFNYFQRASPAAAAKTSPAAGLKSSPQAEGKENNKTSLSTTTPKRPRGDDARNGTSKAARRSDSASTTRDKEGRKSRDGKRFKRLRIESDGDDSDDNGTSMTDGGGDRPGQRGGTSKKRSAESPGSEKSDSPVLDDSEDEYKPNKHETSSDDCEDECVDSAEDSPVKKTPVSAKKVASRTPKSSGSPWTGFSPSTPKSSPLVAAVGSGTKSKLSSFSADGELSATQVNDLGENWPHLKLEFLRSDRIRDATRKKPDDPDYNPRTLYVPPDFLDKQTPAMRQWWVIKSSNYDCIIFFKMGKFYEMYHMDAVLCVKELGLLYMKGEQAHVGFPEISFSRYAAVLVEKGYRVCRIEQTETPEMMQNRVANSKTKTTKYDKVVSREVCQITTRGTRTFNACEGDAMEAELNYLMAIRELEVEGEVRFGVCFVDTSVGEFHLGQFSDDCHCSRLRTLLAHYPPAQLLQPRTSQVQRSREVIAALPSSGCMKETLRLGDEFWTAEKTLRFLAETDYFRDESDPEGEVTWPQTLLDMTRDGDTLHLSPRPECDLALQCLGALVWYLQRCQLHTQLLSMRRFVPYFPPDQTSDKSVDSETDGTNGETRSTESSPGKGSPETGRMVLDGVTLKNLEVLSNSVDGSANGTLLGALDTCVTAFGKRVLRAWLCSPLLAPQAINARLDAVEELISRTDVMDDVTSRLKQLPDLERLIRRIHVQGNGRLSTDHPDARAIMFEEAKYSRSRIMDLLSALSGFRQAAQLLQSLAATGTEFASFLLRCCLAFEADGGKFPDYSDVLNYFDSAFDQAEAKKEGRIIPSAGVDEQFDSANDALDEIQQELDAYLKEQCRHFGCKVVYFGQARNRFQLEVPDAAARRADDSYELQSQKKGAKRFWTATTRDLLARQLAAEEQRSAALRDLNRRMFARFSRSMPLWERAVQCLALLDVLLTLARFSNALETGCRPELVTGLERPVLEVTEGHHPWLGRVSGGSDFIPNDVIMSQGSTLLITGPNMGGKSTLMRQTGLLVILAQLGCYVPAQSVRLTPVDRIFTRLGAQDRIMSGESTFHVELSETAAILQHATTRSLVLVDELGRGTSTFDGSAIASAVLRQLLRIGCRCLFSTHYHSLVEEFQGDGQVWLGHMACMVENASWDDPTQETITFLYKLTDGACPKSYGFNAARLAGIQPDIVRAAYQKAKQFEQRVERKIRFTTVWRNYSTSATPR